MSEEKPGKIEQLLLFEEQPAQSGKVISYVAQPDVSCDPVYERRFAVNRAKANGSGRLFRTYLCMQVNRSNNAYTNIRKEDKDER